MTTCLKTFEKERFCNFPHRHGEATGKPETRDETRGRSKTSISCEASSKFDTFDTLSNKLECHKVPRLPRKPAWKPSKRRGFAASLIDTAKPQENQRLETRHSGGRKTSISCETSAKIHSWKPSKRKAFAASPIDTARPQENQRLETRHVGASKRAFHARHCDLEVAVEVRQCPLRSGSRGWGPAVPTAIWKSRLRSGSAHCDLEVVLAVEVRQCPLGSGARGGSPAAPTGIWTAGRRRRVRRRRRRTALIKSNNPHLAGGEQPHDIWVRRCTPDGEYHEITMN